jgi:hypothetical protein
MKRFNILFLVAMLFSIAAVAQPSGEDVPPDGEPGKCYAKCMIPDEWQNVNESVLVKEATTCLMIGNADIALVTELLKRAANNDGVSLSDLSLGNMMPATFETVTETIMTKPASSRLVEVPAEYGTETETLLVSPAATKWVKRKADKNCLAADPNDCQVWCLVEVPARYETVTKTVMKSAASTKQVEIPAEYQTITKQVEKTPAYPAEICIHDKDLEKPGIKEFMDKLKASMANGGNSKETKSAAEYKNVSKRTLVKKGGFSEWREVLCPVKTTDYTITQIQRALKDAGYDPGPIDGVFGSQTKGALIKFQKANNLPQGRLDIETLKKLGVQ